MTVFRKFIFLVLFLSQITLANAGVFLNFNAEQSIYEIEVHLEEKFSKIPPTSKAQLYAKRKLFQYYKNKYPYLKEIEIHFFKLDKIIKNNHQYIFYFSISEKNIKLIFNDFHQKMQKILKENLIGF